MKYFCKQTFSFFRIPLCGYVQYYSNSSISYKNVTTNFAIYKGRIFKAVTIITISETLATNTKTAKFFYRDGFLRSEKSPIVSEIVTKNWKWQINLLYRLHFKHYYKMIFHVFHNLVQSSFQNRFSWKLGNFPISQIVYF